MTIVASFSFVSEIFGDFFTTILLKFCIFSVVPRELRRRKLAAAVRGAALEGVARRHPGDEPRAVGGRRAGPGARRPTRVRRGTRVAALPAPRASLSAVARRLLQPGLLHPHDAPHRRLRRLPHPHANPSHPRLQEARRQTLQVS
jgi:hypothetical protein